MGHLWMKVSSTLCCLYCTVCTAGTCWHGTCAPEAAPQSTSHWQGTLSYPRTVKVHVSCLRALPSATADMSTTVLAQLRETACILVTVLALRKGIKLSFFFTGLWGQNTCSELFLLLSFPIHRLCESSRDHCGHSGLVDVVLIRTWPVGKASSFLHCQMCFMLGLMQSQGWWIMDADQRRATDALAIYPACRWSAALKDVKNGEIRKATR